MFKLDASIFDEAEQDEDSLELIKVKLQHSLTPKHPDLPPPFNPGTHKVATYEQLVLPNQKSKTSPQSSLNRTDCAVQCLRPLLVEN